MARVMPAGDLQAGEVFYDPRNVGVCAPEAQLAQRARGPLRKVENIRSYHAAGADYMRIEYSTLGSRNVGEIDLRDAMPVAVVQPLYGDEAILRLTALGEGEWLTFFAVEGKVWV